MLVWLPVFFSLLLTIGLTVCIMVGAWFYRSNFFTASFITAGLLFIASGILGNEALVFFKAVYKQWAFRQTIQEKYREVAGA